MTQQTQTDEQEKASHWAEGPDFWDVMDRQIVQDIANYNPVGGDSERACANCQWFVPQTDACVVVQGFPLPIVSNGISDLWQKVVLPSDEMSPIPVTIVGGSSHTEEEEKAATSDKATKTEGGVEYNPSDFAVVPDTYKPSDWKLRLAEDSSGNFTVAQVGRAITAMQPGGFRGNRVQLTSDQKSMAVTRIGRAIGRVDGTDEAKDNLRERLDAVKEITITDKVIKKAKNAFKATLDAMNSIPHKKKQDGSVGEDLNSITFTKDKSGALRWIATYTNNFRDRDNPPEVFTDAAHKQFEDYIDNGGDMPELWLWHTPGTSLGVADWLSYSNGFVTATGLVAPGHEDEVKSLSSMKGLALSHGYKYIPGKNGEIDYYRTFEISILPNQKAANPWTDFAMIESEVKEMKFKEDKRAFLVSVLGESGVATLEKDQEGRAKFLNDLGVDSKEYEESDSTEKETAPADVTELVKQITKGITESDEFKGFVERIGEVEKAVVGISANVKTLGETDEAKINKAFVAAFNPEARGHVASQAKGNEADKSEEKEHEEFLDFLGDVIDAHPALGGAGGGGIVS